MIEHASLISKILVLTFCDTSTQKSGSTIRFILILGFNGCHSWKNNLKKRVKIPNGGSASSAVFTPFSSTTYQWHLLSKVLSLQPVRNMHTDWLLHSAHLRSHVFPLNSDKECSLKTQRKKCFKENILADYLVPYQRILKIIQFQQDTSLLVSKEWN